MLHGTGQVCVPVCTPLVLNSPNLLCLVLQVHGSAPDIAGQDKANPLAMVLSAAMMCRYGLNLPKVGAEGGLRKGAGRGGAGWGAFQVQRASSRSAGHVPPLSMHGSILALPALPLPGAQPWPAAGCRSP